jgi:hypothetical protein
MKKNINADLSNEQIRKIKHRFDYKINESVKYRQLVNTDEEFDQIPTNEADEEPAEDQPKDTKSVGLDAPVPEFEKNAENPEEMPTDNVEATPNQEIVNTEATDDNNVDRIQNDIIKHNIEAMKSIYSKLENLNSSIDNLNNKVDNLNLDVEEVREPSNVEKLINKKNVSYPYYFNLNDLWSKNWFSEKYNNSDEVENGIKRLPDGTYVADFDDISQTSNFDVKKSFNDYQ